MRPTAGVMGGYKNCSSSCASFLRVTVSADISPVDALGLNDLGADVVTPFTASLGGDGGALGPEGRSEEGKSDPPASDENGTAGHDLAVGIESLLS